MALPRIRSERNLPILSETDVDELYRGYWAALSMLSLPELMAESTRLAALIEQGQRAAMTSLLRWDPSSSLDAPVLSSTRPATPPASPFDGPTVDRGQVASMPPSSRPRPPGALDLLLSSSRMGPRLAGRLVNAAVRRRAREAQ